MKPPIFILSSGRCGSTLLQRILNTYPDITIWGEHGGILRQVAEEYFWLLERPGNDQFLFGNRPDGAAVTREQIEEEKKPGNWQAWLNWFSRTDLPEIFRAHLRSYFQPPFLPADSRWGFKEIRYGLDDRVIEFLNLLYPDAIFVFMARDGFNTVASQLKAWHSTSAISLRFDQHLPGPRLYKHAREWVRQNRAFLRWHQSGKLNSYWIAFEDLAKGKPVMQPLLDALGKQMGPEQQAVLTMSEGRGTAFEKKQDAVESRSRFLGFAPLVMAEMIMGGVNRDLGYTSPEPVRWINHLRRLFDFGRPKVTLRQTSE